MILIQVVLKVNDGASNADQEFPGLSTISYKSPAREKVEVMDLSTTSDEVEIHPGLLKGAELDIEVTWTPAVEARVQAMHTSGAFKTWKYAPQNGAGQTRIKEFEGFVTDFEEPNEKGKEKKFKFKVQPKKAPTVTQPSGT